MARHGIFPQLRKNEDTFDEKQATVRVSPNTQNLVEEKSEAVRFPEITDRTSSAAELNFANNGHNSLLPLDKQLVRKLWERRLILDAFSLENPSLASILEGHPSLASIMVESEGRSSRGQGGGLGGEFGGGIGTGEVRFPGEKEVGEEAEGRARFNLKMAQLEQLLADQPEPDNQETFRR